MAFASHAERALRITGARTRVQRYLGKGISEEGREEAAWCTSRRDPDADDDGAAGRGALLVERLPLALPSLLRAPLLARPVLVAPVPLLRLVPPALLLPAVRLRLHLAALLVASRPSAQRFLPTWWGRTMRTMVEGARRTAQPPPSPRAPHLP